MSQDSFTEVSTQSWFGRIGGAIKGVLVGLLLIAIAIILLFWNEGRSVKRYKTLKEGQGRVVSVKADPVSVDNEGKLVHVTGRADTGDMLTDPVFGISEKALKFIRNVRMYQWQETARKKTKKKLGGGKKTITTYTYTKVWSDKLIHSDNFKHPDGHQNPTAMPYNSIMLFADKVSLGAFTLPRSMVDRIGGEEGLPVGSADLSLPDGRLARANNGEYYVGVDSASPEIGDVRVSFSLVPPGDVSVIAKQVGNTFEPYETDAGGNIDLLETGIHSAQSMFKTARNSNKFLTWILRLVGFVLMVVGFMLIFNPLSVIADVVPLIGSIIGVGTGIIAFLLSLVLSLFVIGFAWVFYRPFIGVPLLIVAVALVVLTRGKLKKAKV